MKLSRIRPFGFALALALLLVGTAMAQRSTGESVARCDRASDCAPKWSGLVVVYVVDAMGAAIDDAAISVVPTPPQGVLRARNKPMTDYFGMAAISLEPGTRYRLNVRALGFQAIDVEDVASAAGRPSFLRVQLELDPAQLK